MKKVRLLLFIPVILWMAVIFWFSSNNGDKSTIQSSKITYGIASIADKVFHLSMTGEQKTELAENMSFFVRKTAHFTEYLILALLVWGAMKANLTGLAPGILYGATVAWVFIYAASDELHQHFVDGRCSSIKDVLIDTAGGITGVLIIMTVRHIYRKHAYNR